MRAFEGYYRKLTMHREAIYCSLFDECRPILVGLGCADGSLTLEVAKRTRAERIVGIDLDDDALAKAKKKGILAIKADLNSGFPIRDESIDIVGSDQVIEHVRDVDTFVEEMHRILRPGGYAVVSTENLSSWHNIFAILLGKQAFSQQISSRHHVGNPFSLHFGEPLTVRFPHVHIFTVQGLKDILRIYGFYVDKVRGIGYFPIPAALGGPFEVIDSTHSYFLAVRARRMEDTTG
jgi:SAM-dependent methyltransferase